MKNKTQITTASLIMVVAGLWLASLPLFMTLEGGSLVSTLVSGGILAVVGLGQLFMKSTVPSMIGVIAGLWVVVSPFVFSAGDAFLYNSLVAGVVAFIVSIWDTLEVSESYDTTTYAR